MEWFWSEDMEDTVFPEGEKKTLKREFGIARIWEQWQKMMGDGAK